MNMTQWVARSTAAFILIAVGALAHAADLQEGKDYRWLAKPQPVETGKKIEVIEFFSFSCPHCKDAEPILSPWVKTLPANVQFRRIPVQFQPAWIGTSKVWYTLEALNEERLVPAVFNAIHGQNVRLDQDKTFFDWAAAQGLDRKKVEDMYNSFAVNGKVARAKTLVQNYGVQSVPTFVVDGKFTTETGQAKRHEDMPPLLEKLIDKVRTERK
jgi:thiol:disulfide interchange protein DsbA